MSATQPRTQELYEVTVEGDYYALVDGRKTIRPYKVKVYVPEKATKVNTLSVIKKNLLAKVLKKKYPDYTRYRTYTITDTSCGDKEIKVLALMNLKQITSFIQKKQLPIDLALFPSVQELRRAILDFKESPETFEAIQKRREETMGDKLAMERALKRANPDLFDEDEIQNETKKPAKTDQVGVTTDDFDLEDDLDELVAGL